MHDGPTHARERSPLSGSAGGRRPAGTPDPIDELTELFLGGMVGGAMAAGATPILDDDLPLPPLKTEPHPREARPATPPAPLVEPKPSVRPVRTAEPGPRRLPVEVVVVGHLPVAAAAWVHQYARFRQRRLRAAVALARWRGSSVSIDLVGEGAPFDLPACASIEEALGLAARVSASLIVSVDETHELEVATLAGVERITVLTGSHDTAVVACYRALKGLVAAEPVREGRTMLAVAVLGGPEERSRAAAARLEKTSAAYLSHAVPCEVSSDKIGPGRSMPLFAGTAEEAPASTLRALLPGAGAPAGVGGVGGAVSSGAGMAAEGPRAGEPAALLGKFPMLRMITARCPFAPGVEFGVGEDGQLHAVASARQGADVPRAVADLTAATAWVQTNAEVLRAAIPELAARVGVAAPREHLVTAEPKAVRGLLDSRLRLHAEAADGTLMDLN